MAGASLSIGEVIALLRDDFPDVSVSKIRFLESQGLIDPERSAGGYRQFGPVEIRRLRYILALQRDHFLPLKVIKSRLTMWERGEARAEEDEGDGRLGDEGEPLTRTDLLRRSGLGATQLDELVDHGIFGPREEGSTVFPSWALEAAVECRRLLADGFEPRHLRAVRLGAEREAELLRQLAAPLLSQSTTDARTRARETLENGATAISALHRTILNATLRSLLEE
jgi:DNA-binding transcriptional MerR regulator